MAHSFGKYLIEIYMTNGEHGFFMEEMNGGIALTDHEDAASRFFTESGAVKHYNKIRNLPHYIYKDVYIDNAYIVKARNI